eukprot:8209728-Pyramimonas_sp.AAC.1
MHAGTSDTQNSRTADNKGSVVDDKGSGVDVKGRGWIPGASSARGSVRRRATNSGTPSSPAGEYTRNRDQSGKRRGHILAVRTNRARGGGVYIPAGGKSCAESP